MTLDLFAGLEERIRAIVDERVNERLEELQTTASPWLSVKQAAEHMTCSSQRVYDLLSDGRIPKYKDGRRVLLRREHLDAYLEDRPMEEPATATTVGADSPEVASLLEEILATHPRAATEGLS
jgi:excisionase family DNA binding protein